MYDGDVLGSYTRLLGSPSFWLLNVIVVVVCFIPDLTYIAVKNFFKAKKIGYLNDLTEITQL